MRGLTVLGDVAASIQSWRRKEFRTSLAVLEQVPEDDPDTRALVSAGAHRLLPDREPGHARHPERDPGPLPADIMAALALYRPGPLKGGLRDAFVRRHNRLRKPPPTCTRPWPRCCKRPTA
jgi:hypothetical protein